MINCVVTRRAAALSVVMECANHNTIVSGFCVRSYTGPPANVTRGAPTSTDIVRGGGAYKLNMSVATVGFNSK